MTEFYDAELDRELTYFKKYCVTPWYKVLYRTLFVQPDPSFKEAPLTPPDAETAASLKSCTIPWYKTFFS